MNNNEKPAFLRGKGAAVSLVICFAAVIVLVGAYTFSNYRNDMEGDRPAGDGKYTDSG